MLLKIKAYYLLTFCLVILSFACSAESITPKLSPDGEAEAEAQRYWNSILAKCGDSYYARDNRGTPGAERIIMQFKDVTFEVNELKITEAEKLNGIEWSGWAIFNTKVSRFYLTKWESWRNGAVFPVNTMLMRKEKGKWIFGVNEKSQPNLKKIDCSDVPTE
jgi:hypothetical protein